ncbi:hypothetical protein CBR_g34718 [Chara braunii]|uniref:Uncharacterized protein n=1 Tax=Chara braunii TaxID=69332 RepID=A0A388JZ18_CHABU|nr:hypothetical protein CBR_g34718 [Chara braunii]|eukprot:GBG63017.1 hypothetical protein CBR_g34718 [Chara braunii]
MSWTINNQSTCQIATLHNAMDLLIDDDGPRIRSATRKREIGQRFGFALMASYAGVVIASRFVEQPCMSALLALEDSPLRGEMMVILQENFPDHSMLKQELKRQEEGKGKGFAIYDETGKRTYPRLPRREDGIAAPSREAIARALNVPSTGSQRSSGAPTDRVQRDAAGYSSVDVSKEGKGGGNDPNDNWESRWTTGGKPTADLAEQTSSWPWRRATDGEFRVTTGGNRPEEDETSAGSFSVGDGMGGRMHQGEGRGYDAPRYQAADAGERAGLRSPMSRQARRVTRDKNSEKGAWQGGGEQANSDDTPLSDPFTLLYADGNSGADGEAEGRSSSRKLMTREERRRAYMARTQDQQLRHEAKQVDGDY